MYRKIVWCYVFILTLLDISLNTKLSAQGKSHGVTVHDSLIEGITFQEWGKESVGEGGARGAGGRAVSAGALALSPPALDFGRAALAAAHSLTVTLTNTANTTMHLASVAGTTPDFHASFFESKTLPPQANTTFSVVYLGRREGPVSAHLYIHTSLGVHKYPVSAVGVASEWGVWPLVGVRVPLNATVEPLLTMHNPTDQTIQHTSDIIENTPSPRPIGRNIGRPISKTVLSSEESDSEVVENNEIFNVLSDIDNVSQNISSSHKNDNDVVVSLEDDLYLSVSEVYSSGAWLGLQLPDGAGAAPRAAWALPPRSRRALVRLRLTPPHLHTLTAYIRIKANITGGGLVVCVEARPAPAGEYASPLQLRLHTRGSMDPADVMHVSLGNSAGAGVSLEAGVWAARCEATPPAPPPPPLDVAHDAHNGDDKGTANGNGVKSDGVYVSLLRSHLEPHQPLTDAAQITFDYAKMWAGYGGGGGAGSAGAWCGGWVVLGRAALPYSVRLLPGHLQLLPDTIHFVTANEDEVVEAREVRVRNDFPVHVHVASVDLPHEEAEHFEVESLVPMTVPPGATAVLALVRLRRGAAAGPRRAALTLRTNLTDYTLPLLVYSGTFDIEWEWPNSADGALRLGVLGTSSTRRVRARLHHRAPVALCVRAARLQLAGAQLALHDCPPHHACRCVEEGGSLWAWLTVVAPARAGPLAGHVEVLAGPAGGQAALLRAPVTAHAQPGRLAAPDLTLAHAAPYAWSSAPLVLDSSMALTMRVQDVTLPTDNPALSYLPPSEAASREVSSGRHAVGTIVYAAEKLCEPDCYTGLDINSPEGVAWERRSSRPDAAALALDAALQAARYRRYSSLAPRANVSLHVHTEHVVQLRVGGAVRLWWPRLLCLGGDAGLAPVGGAVPLRLRARNPSRSHALLLQPVVGPPLHALMGNAESGVCRSEACAWALDAFRLAEWRATRGAVRAWPQAPPPQHDQQQQHNASAALPPLLLAPDAEVEFKLTFAPQEARALTAYLYLRNNLTIMEGVQLSGRGAFPSFELGGRRPGTNTPLLFEVSECGGAGGGTVRRTVVARNTGRVRVRLRGWRVAGSPCQARGFRVSPCAALSLAPNESRPLTLAFTPDWTLARVRAALELRSDLGRASFVLSAAAPPALLARCAPAARPAWEPALRAAGELLALAALALVLAAAALDAERELRRARQSRPAPAPPSTRAPLDLRAIAREPQTPPVTVARRPAARRRRPPRAPVDPAAERRAFERWRHDVLRRQDDDERSSEDNEHQHQPEQHDQLAPQDDAAPLLDREAPEPAGDPPAPNDGYEADPETEDRPQGSGDDDAGSTGSGSASASSSSPVADVDSREDDGGDERSSPPRLRPEPERGSSPAAVRGGGAAGAEQTRAVRARRAAADPMRRAGTTASEARARPPPPKPHARKDKAGKRRAGASTSPARSPARASQPAALRWGASWSSVVAARPAALAPIGSDVRRRPEPAPSDHSLFYFNGDATHATHATPHDADFAWRPPPPVERPTFSPARDFLDEPGGVGGVGGVGSVGSVGSVGNGSYRSMSNSVWGSMLEPRPAASAWLWGGFGEGAAVRPPPGFGAPPRAVRPYDPFRSLASIWAPGASDWRADEPADEPH